MDRPLAIRPSPSLLVPTEQREKVVEFWKRKKAEIEAIEDFGDRDELPMTRLKKVLVAEIGKMAMITFDTPSFMTRASEVFVQELALRAWMSAASHHRAIILETDVAAAVAATEAYDFLGDVVHAFQREYGTDAPSYKPDLPVTDDEKLLSAGSAGADGQQSSSSQLVLGLLAPPNQAVPQFIHPDAVVPAPFPALSAPASVRHVPTLPFLFPFRFPLQATPPVMSTAVTPARIATAPMLLPSPPANASCCDTTMDMLASSTASSLLMNMASTTDANPVHPGLPFGIVGGATSSTLGQPVPPMEHDSVLPALAAEEVASIMHAYDDAAVDNAKDGNTDVKQEQQATADLDDGQQQKEQQEEEHEVEMEAVPSLPDLDAAPPPPRMSLLELEELLLGSPAAGDDYNVSWDDVDSWAASFWGDITAVNPAAPLPPPAAEDDGATNSATSAGPALPPPFTGGEDDMHDDDDPKEKGEGLGDAGSPSPGQEAAAAAPGSPLPAS